MGVVSNEGVFRFLGRRRAAERGPSPVIPADDPNRDYYYEAGAHPEVVARLWDQLGKSLSVGSKVLVFGTPALVEPGSGVVLAFALGTEYALRLPRRLWKEKGHSALRTVAKWTGGGSTDIERECGKEWIFGSFATDEIEWCEEVSREFGGGAG
jgi:hypothetical protein